MLSKRKTLHILKPQSSGATLIEKTIAANGEYNATDDNADGYSEVTVSIPPTLFRSLVDRSITSVTAEDLAGVTAIGAYAFANCSLTSATIPNSVTLLGTSAFYNCTSLQNIVIPDSVTAISIDGFRDCTALQRIKIGTGVTVIAQAAFFGCSSATEIDIGNSVQMIANSAFQDCVRIKRLIFPATLTSVGSSVLWNTPRLETLVVKATTPPTLSGVLSGYEFDAFVPYSADYSILNAYKSATNWSVLANYIYPLVEVVAELANIDPTAYTKACVIGADNSYTVYIYNGSSWNPIV